MVIKKKKGGEGKEGKKGVNVGATIPKEQYRVIKKLVGTMGTSEKGVISNIINMWLYSQDWFLDTIKEQVKIK